VAARSQVGPIFDALRVKFLIVGGACVATDDFASSGAAFASAKVTSASTRASTVASVGVISSASLWLMPSLQGIKIMSVGWT